NDPNRPSVHGYNFMDNSVNIIKSQHGTHVAGTIAAVNNNGKGICGIAGGDYANGVPGVRLMSAQIFKDGEKGSGNGARAIKWGADHGAVISQNSWGYDEIDYVPNSDRMAIDYFNTYAGMDANGNQVGPMAGGLVVFAAGNENIDFGAPAYYEGALAVGSIGADFFRAYYSCYGDWVDVAAPGGDYQKGYQIYSTLPDNKYGLMQGTSMACPHVSGVAALIVSYCGGDGFTRDMLWNRIVNTAKDISSKNRNFPVGGLVDVTAAILAEGSIPPDPVTDFQAELQNADFIRFSLTVPHDEDNNKANGINIYYSTEPFSETTLIPYKKFPVDESLQAGDLMVDILQGLQFETTYYLACEAYDLIGNRSDLSNTVIVKTGKNHAPTVSTDDPMRFTLKSHETRWLSFSYSEPDGHGVHAKLDKGSPADSLQPLLNLTQKIEVNALRTEPGTYEATLHVFDDYEMESTLSYTYTIQPNHAPKTVGQIEDLVFGTKNEVLTVDLSEVFSDEDQEILQYTTTSSDNDILNLHVREGILYVTALRYGYGTGSITATDARGESTGVSFQTLARDGSKAVDIYPNTITDGKLYIRTANDQSVNAKVTSEAGTVVLEKTLTATPFSPAILDLSTLGGGPYAVEVTVGSETFTQNIVKL
ncbi:MAG: S8 family peptidase, partial [Bacteroidales bacterium]|nr:S8 family peptidase [Bacteroidales bacterium]